MALDGQAKRDYQREYMQRRRAEAAGSNKPKIEAVRPSKMVEVEAVRPMLDLTGEMLDPTSAELDPEPYLDVAPLELEGPPADELASNLRSAVTVGKSDSDAAAPLGEDGPPVDEVAPNLGPAASVGISHTGDGSIPAGYRSWQDYRETVASMKAAIAARRAKQDHL